MWGDLTFPIPDCLSRSELLFWYCVIAEACCPTELHGMTPRKELPPDTTMLFFRCASPAIMWSPVNSGTFQAETQSSASVLIEHWANDWKSYICCLFEIPMSLCSVFWPLFIFFFRETILSSNYIGLLGWNLSSVICHLSPAPISSLIFSFVFNKDDNNTYIKKFFPVFKKYSS